MTYRESLPENCPPDTADEITSPRLVYRLVRNNPPTDDDFRSQRAEQPDRVFRNISECQARGLSVAYQPRIRSGSNGTSHHARPDAMPGTTEPQLWAHHANRRRPTPQHVVAAGGLPHTGKLLPGDDMTTIKHTQTLVYYDGVQVFAGQDAGGDNYIGAMIDAVGDADRYLVVAAASAPLRRFYAGEIDLRTLLMESSASGWYTALIDDDFAQPVSLEMQQRPLLEMDYLPEAGFRLTKRPEEDLMPANPADD